MRHQQSGIFYIGSTSDLPRRSKEHLKELKRGVHCNPRLQAAFNECHYFSWDTHPVDTIEEARDLELSLIHKNGTDEKLVNFTGRSLDEEQKEKKRAWWTEEKCDARSKSMIGLIRSEETKEKMAIAARARVRDPEVMLRVNALKGKGVIIDGVTYTSYRSAGAALNVDGSTVTSRCKSTDPKWATWTFPL